MPRDESRGPQWQVIGLCGLLLLVVVGIGAWIWNAGSVDHWLAVHTGTINESGPYYGFWSGFGSDIAEFGLLGAIGTAVYQVVKKYNCHEPGCWRVGTHPAAGGQFLLCYRHHPDFRGVRPTHDLIVRMHHQHVEQEAAVRDKLHEIDQRLGTRGSDKESAMARTKDRTSTSNQ